MANCIQSMVSAIIPTPKIDPAVKESQLVQQRAAQARITEAKKQQLDDRISDRGSFGLRSLIGGGARAGFRGN